MDIYERISTFAADMEVPSSFLNAMQDRDQDIVAKAASDQGFLSLCRDGSHSMEIEYFDTGGEGTRSSAGAGQVAEISYDGGTRTAEFSYDGDRLDSVAMTEGSVSRVARMVYDDITGNVTGITVSLT